MKKVFIFRFDEGIDKQLIEHLIAESIRAAEHYYGKPLVRLNVAYLVSKNSAVINVMDDVGEFVLRIFTGNVSDEVGDNHFTVESKSELKGDL